jgi:hypothetical protein
MRQIADREIARREEIEKTLDYIHRQLGQLEVTAHFPDALTPTTAVINRALDVKSAVLVYISVHIRHESNTLGIVGICSDFVWLISRKHWDHYSQRIARV